MSRQQPPKKTGQKLIDITGKVYGRLTVLSVSHRDGRRRYFWNCKCECGNLYVARGTMLHAGRCTSCGCYKKVCMITHGQSRVNRTSKEYRTWANIKTRCFSRNVPGYQNYGGRGITMCDRWANSFENFLSDMGYAPSSKHSIERIDNDGNYEPSNCRWASRIEQQNNTRMNVWITSNGETKTIAQWSRALGIRYRILWGMIATNKWPTL